jgi:hypothetical protein
VSPRYAEPAYARLRNAIAVDRTSALKLNGTFATLHPVLAESCGTGRPTKATRMDRFVDALMAPAGLLAMIGKAERGPEAGCDQGHPSAQWRIPVPHRRRCIPAFQRDP